MKTSFRPRLHAFIFSAGDILQRPLEVLAWIIETGGVVVGIEIRMDKLDKTVEVLGRHLVIVSVIRVKDIHT